MTVRRAFQILINHAAANQAGVECGGYRSIPTEHKREEIVAAIAKLWTKVYGFPFDRSQQYNDILQLPPERAAR